MKKLSVNVLLVMLALLSACQFLPTEITSQPKNGGIVTSEGDDRAYEYLTLSNGIRVLLISDEKVDKAAAALNVAVGSGHDPEHRQGLAHFLEHMLFLGTDKYPEAGEYQAFISAHSGSHNAYTAFENTNYFFDIDPAYLEPTLDRFARFFVAPLFNSVYVDREKNAVHSEYQAKIKDDARRELDVFKAEVNPAHPFANFSVGSLKTLGGDVVLLRQDLIAFYERYYSADNMTLTVIGNQPLADLREMIVSRFEQVPVRDVSHTAFSDQPLFIPDTLPKRVTIVPEKQVRELSLNFPLPPLQDYYRSKPAEYLAGLIGDESPGSVLSWLKAKGWAEGLSAGLGLDYSNGSMLGVKVKMTKAGVNHQDEIIEAIFSAIRLIKEEGISAQRYQEQSQLADIHFRFRESPTPIYEVSQLARNLRYYAVEDVFRGPYMMADYDRRVIEKLLSQLTPENCLIHVLVPDAKTDKKSPHYATPYRVDAIPEATLGTWLQPRQFAELGLPALNEFIPENLTLYPLEKPVDSQPKIVYDDAIIKVWHKQSENHRIPKGNLIVQMDMAALADSPIASAYADMYVAMIKDQLNEFSYPATLAGLHYDLSANSQGIMLRIGGYTDKQGKLLAELLAAMQQPEWKQQRFDRLKQKKLRGLRNAAKRTPYQLLFDDMTELLLRNQWTEQQLIPAYEQIELNLLSEFFEQQLFKQTAIKMLAHGNYRKADAMALSKQLLAGFSEIEALTETLTTDVAKLSSGELHYLAASEHNDAAVIGYIQADTITRKSRAAMGITAQLMKADFYTELRTRQQLGYIVNASAYPIREVPALAVLVQSPVAAVASIEQAMNQFFKDFYADEKLTKAYFEENKLALIAKLQESAKNLSEQTERYWQAISQNYPDFDMREQIVAALKTLRFSEWQDFYQKNLLGAERRVLWLETQGKFKLVDKPERIEHQEAIKAKSEYYEF